MVITRLNHAVLYVSDAERSSAFYEEILGFRRIDLGRAIPGAVFLQAPGSTNDHDLALFGIGADAEVVAGATASGPGPRRVGLYHLAWEVDTLDDLERLGQVLSQHGALVGASDHGTTKSLYAKDRDGIEFEVAWIVPAALLDDQARQGRTTIRPLDLAAEKERYGAATPGGVGISR